MCAKSELVVVLPWVPATVNAFEFRVIIPNTSERFFPADKIVLTGNPTRKEMVEIEGKRDEALAHFGLEADKKTILIIGGSLGARTLNKSIQKYISQIPEDTQVIWQCGKFYFEGLKQELESNLPNRIKLMQFVQRMDLAYALADVIISRAGAISVSELCIIGKPVILVPSPNVAEDHQTKNAMALVEVGAAELIKDVAAEETLMPACLELLQDGARMANLSSHIKKLAKPNATSQIAETILSAGKKRSNPLYATQIRFTFLANSLLVFPGKEFCS